MTIPTTARLSITPPAKACHNCRRNRLRCDRSLPQCQKCSSKGDQCLGYGRLLRWTNAVAVRGRLAEQVGQRPSPMELTGSNGDDNYPGHATGEISKLEVGLPVYAVKLALVDPLLKDLGPQQRLYISHCELFHPSCLISTKLQMSSIIALFHLPTYHKDTPKLTPTHPRPKSPT